MNRKAERFQNFIREHQIQDSFSISEHNESESGRNFVLFDTSVEVKGEYLRLVVILEEGLQSIIRMWILGRGFVNEQNKKHVLAKLNKLNMDYKSFKFFLDEKNNVIMDWINSTPDQLFDPNLLHFILGIINREAEYMHSSVMSAIKV